jgi:hypothetical protein
MKTNLILLLVLSILAATACQEQIDVDKEKEAIIAVVNAQSEAYLARDLETLSSYMVQDSTNIRLSANKWQYEYNLGWEKVSELYEKDFADDSAWAKFENLRYERKDFNIKVYPKSAWAVFKTVYMWEEDTIPNKWKSIESRILEKVDGEWKIAYQCNIGKSSYKKKEKEEEAAEGAEAETEAEKAAE